MRFSDIQHNFFIFITNNFGDNITRSLKLWININRRILLIKSRILFLKSCRTHNICPTHLSFLLDNFRFSSFNSRVANRQKYVIGDFVSRTLRNEIIDAYSNISQLAAQLQVLARFCSDRLPKYVWYKFCDTQILNLEKFFNVKMTDCLANLFI